MNIERLFGAHPPKELLVNLAAIVRDWQWRFGPGGPYEKRRDQVVEFCRDAYSLQVAIFRACRSRGADGKMHNHQTRVPEAIRLDFARRIFANLDWRCSSFDELYDLLDEVKPAGIGPVTTYDVATRIAAYLQIEPTSLYLHAGVREAWGYLFGPTKALRIPREELPAPLQALPADEVEDLLCTYREIIKCW